MAVAFVVVLLSQALILLSEIGVYDKTAICGWNVLGSLGNVSPKRDNRFLVTLNNSVFKYSYTTGITRKCDTNIVVEIQMINDK